jgi:hypothetical protein
LHQPQGEQTSLAADPSLADGSDARLFHASCFAERRSNLLDSYDAQGT